jgi:hypothetical protein
VSNGVHKDITFIILYVWYFVSIVSFTQRSQSVVEGNQDDVFVQKMVRLVVTALSVLPPSAMYEDHHGQLVVPSNL